ncbi:MAG: hypothetical protein QM817_29765 [Archangium sp.]
MALLLTGCVSAFERVRQTDTIEQARRVLKGETPTSITKYPPNAEAWYFGKNQCVLFVDGKQREWRSSITEAEQGHVLPSEVQAVLCSPSGVKDNTPPHEENSDSR